MKALTGTVTVITGGSSGIGRATALLLAEQGSRIVLPYSSTVDRGSALAESVAADIRKAGSDVVLLEADVSRLPDIDNLFDVAQERFGRIDHVVHCAAMLLSKPVVQITEADYDRVFAVNAKGAFFVLQQAAQRVRDGGRIVAFSSPAARQYSVGGSIYGATKAAVESYVRVLAWELAPRGITVNAISPGATNTAMLPASYRDLGAAASPFKRLGEPRDVAESVYLLLLPEAHWITGQVWFATGGAVMA